MVGGDGGAFEIITFGGGFHGRTLATMSASGKPGFDTMFAPQVPGFPKARLNDIDSVLALVGPHTVAVMLEPIQGEAGVIEARPAFLQAQHVRPVVVEPVEKALAPQGADAVDVPGYQVQIGHACVP